jgi:hypothetical protein
MRYITSFLSGSIQISANARSNSFFFLEIAVKYRFRAYAQTSYGTTILKVLITQNPNEVADIVLFLQKAVLVLLLMPGTES